MALPKWCCCCIDLETGCFLLSVLSIIGHCSIFIDTYLGYDHSPEDLTQDADQIMNGTIFVWRVIGVVIILTLILGVAMRNLDLMKTYFVIGGLEIVPAVARNIYVLYNDPLYGLKLMVINAISIYLWIIAYTIYKNFKAQQLKSHDRLFDVDPETMRLRSDHHVAVLEI